MALLLTKAKYITLILTCKKTMWLRLLLAKRDLFDLTKHYVEIMVTKKRPEYLR